MAKTLSPLERLPPELLQPIFLFSDFSLALVDSSHHIAAKLAHPHIYHEVCAHYLTERFLPQTKPAIQKRIFSSKWMTWEFLKSFVTRYHSPKGCLCGRTRAEGCFDEQYRVWPPDFENATTMQFHLYHLPALAFVNCDMPLRLLRGPWTREKTEFVRFVLWTTSMCIDLSDTHVRQVVVEARKNAILERNLEAVQIFNYDPRLKMQANLSTLRFAVMEAGCDRSIVYDILSTTPQNAWAGEGRVRPTLYEWCERGIKEGNPRAKWLQLKLRELRGTAGHSTKRYGDLVAKSGDYDGGEDDRLVVKPHPQRRFILTRDER